MKVWILMGGYDHGDSCILGVYVSSEDAHTDRPEDGTVHTKTGNRYDGYWIETWDVVPAKEAIS